MFIVKSPSRTLATLALATVALVSMTVSSSVAAQTKNTSIISESRLGINTHGINTFEDGIVDVSASVLFHPVTGYGNPRPHVGVSASSATSLVYTGLTWTNQNTSPLLFDFEFGIAANNGMAEGSAAAKKTSMGCVLGFHETVSVGYRFNRSLSLMATIEHFSNGKICEPNTGLTNAGLRIGYSY